MAQGYDWTRGIYFPPQEGVGAPLQILPQTKEIQTRKKNKTSESEKRTVDMRNQTKPKKQQHDEHPTNE